MKKLLLALLLAPSGIFAQQTITLSPAYVAQGSTCPAPVMGYNQVIAYTTGLVPGNDSVDIYVDFGDGNDSAQRVAVYPNGNSQYIYSSIDHAYNTPGIYTVTMTATTPDNTFDTRVFTDRVLVANACNSITGRIYRDNNNNCTYDAGDVVVPYQYIGLRVHNSAAQFSAYTSINGDYQASAFVGGTYDIYPIYQGGTRGPLGCSLPDTITFSATGSDVIDFPLQPVTIVTANDISDSVGTVCYGNGVVNMMGYASYYGDGSLTQLQLHINFGDGHDTTFMQSTYPAGGLFQSANFWLSHYYAAPGHYSVMYDVYDPVSGAADTIARYNMVDLSDSCGNISGNVYEDLNNSCAWDAGDDTLAYAYVLLYQGSQVIAGDYAGTSGGYSFDVPAGNYTISLVNYVNTFGYSMACSTTSARTITLAPQGSVTEDFGLVCNSSTGDAAAHLSGWGARPGLPAYLYPSLQVLSCIPQSGTITLVLDPLTTFAGTCDSIIPFTVNGNTVSWSYSNVMAYYYWYQFIHCVILNVDPGAQIGDSLCFTMYITPSVTDANPYNDTVHFCMPVRNSWDPNEKEVSPAGISGNGHVAPNTEMIYTIHFQNTGNDVAYSIAITDTLDPSLDLSSLQITGSSHQVDPDIIGNNVMRFNFYNINLPDSSSNEPLSHGWITYKVAQNQWLPDGTPIDNTAYIYFDFNDAIVTNTTHTIVDWALSVNDVAISNGLQAFPVPADDYLNLTSEQALNGTIIIRDISGREVRTQAINGTRAQLFTGDLTEGVYMISITSNGVTVNRKVMVSH